MIASAREHYLAAYATHTNHFRSLFGHASLKKIFTTQCFKRFFDLCSFFILIQKKKIYAIRNKLSERVKVLESMCIFKYH